MNIDKYSELLSKKKCKSSYSNTLPSPYLPYLLTSKTMGMKTTSSELSSFTTNHESIASVVAEATFGSTIRSAVVIHTKAVLKERVDEITQNYAESVNLLEQYKNDKKKYVDPDSDLRFVFGAFGLFSGKGYESSYLN